MGLLPPLLDDALAGRDADDACRLLAFAAFAAAALAGAAAPSFAIVTVLLLETAGKGSMPP